MIHTVNRAELATRVVEWYIVYKLHYNNRRYYLVPISNLPARQSSFQVQPLLSPLVHIVDC